MTTGFRLEALVLAAGFGARFGGNKLSSPYGAGRLIDGALAAARAAPVRAVTVVTGADAAIEAIARAAGARTVHADHHALGLSTSLKTGIASLPDDCDGAFVFLGDMPRVPAGVLGPMAKALEAGAGAAAPVFDGRRGHPVLFSRALFPALMDLEGDKGAGGLLDGLAERLALIEAPNDGVLFDVDLPNPPSSS